LVYKSHNLCLLIRLCHIWSFTAINGWKWSYDGSTELWNDNIRFMRHYFQFESTCSIIWIFNRPNSNHYHGNSSVLFLLMDVIKNISVWRYDECSASTSNQYLLLGKHYRICIFYYAYLNNLQPIRSAFRQRKDKRGKAEWHLATSAE
jgi:hypothetical protein